MERSKLKDVSAMTEVTLPVQLGHWGDWQAPVVIPSDYYIYGMQVRYESFAADQDDTALNGIKLLCADVYGSGTTQIISVHEGFWGKWRKRITVPSGCYAVGLATRIEPKQGSNGDDTALNGIKMIYRNYDTMQLGEVMIESGNWGDWAGYATFEPDHLMSGIQVRMEQPLHTGDDTAMNGLKIIGKPLPVLDARRDALPDDGRELFRHGYSKD